jgi:hypothetical protein
MIVKKKQVRSVKYEIYIVSAVLINERKKKMLKVQFHAHEIIINSF